jgi:hypothetical protein
MEAVNATTTTTLASVLADVVGVREMWWRWMASNFNDFALFSYVFYAYLISGYILVGGFLFLIDHFNLFPQYKIQKGVSFLRSVNLSMRVTIKLTTSTELENT